MINSSEARSLTNQSVMRRAEDQIPKDVLTPLEKTIEDAAGKGLSQVVYDIDANKRVDDMELYEIVRSYLLFLGYQVTVCRLQDKEDTVRLWLGW